MKPGYYILTDKPVRAWYRGPLISLRAVECSARRLLSGRSGPKRVEILWVPASQMLTGDTTRRMHVE